MNDSSHAVLLLDALLQRSRSALDGGHVDLVERRQVRGRVLRLEQVLGDALPARRHLLARLARAVAVGGRAGGATGAEVPGPAQVLAARRLRPARRRRWRWSLAVRTCGSLTAVARAACSITSAC